MEISQKIRIITDLVSVFEDNEERSRTQKKNLLHTSINFDVDEKQANEKNKA